MADFPTILVPRLYRDNPSPAPALLTCPHSSVILQYRNINLLSIGYGSRPHLRSRLTQGRSALPWKPWIFGLEDSHLYLATHSGILSSMQSREDEIEFCKAHGISVHIDHGLRDLQLVRTNENSYTRQMVRTIKHFGKLLNA